MGYCRINRREHAVKGCSPSRGLFWASDINAQPLPPALTNTRSIAVPRKYASLVCSFLCRYKCYCVNTRCVQGDTVVSRPTAASRESNLRWAIACQRCKRSNGDGAKTIMRLIADC